MTDSFEDLYAQLVAERGGAQALGVIGQSIARALAAALTDPSTPPATISNLASLLPAPRAPGEKALDLRILTNAELRTLEFLVARASGSKEPKPPRVKRTARADRALGLAAYLDDASRRGVGTGQHNKTPPTDREANTIRNLIFSVVGNVANIDSLYSYLAARPVAPAAVVERSLAPKTSEPEVSSADNVVTLPKRLDIHAGVKIANHDEPWRGGVLPNLT